MGGIGRAVGVRAAAFGMKIQYHNRSRLSLELEAAGGNASYVSFDELIRTSDVISVNLSLTPATRHIIGRPEFANMKDGVVIVNTARGPVIDEAALVEALDNGKVYSAGLDVFEEEPKIHPGLLKNENVVLLPHIGTATIETQVRHYSFSALDSALTNIIQARYGDPGARQSEARHTRGQALDPSSRTNKMR